MMLRTRGGEPEQEAEMDNQRSPLARGARTSRSHSEAERKRRQRINAHLATLRSLLPSASQMDKAALLGEVVRHVRELRGDADGGAVAGVAVPGESDEVGVEEERWDARESAKRVRAWVCCADRPGLMSELGRAVRSVSARAVRAEIATVGGRTRSVLELEAGYGQAAGRVTAGAARGAPRRAAHPGGSAARRGELQEAVLLGAHLPGFRFCNGSVEVQALSEN
ncbi:bHLH transcription factor [Hordeum vulgare]|nr:bHLH transcription factor [Hordeum vulgare]